MILKFVTTHSLKWFENANIRNKKSRAPMETRGKKGRCVGEERGML